jgi:hypothetical protein
MALITMLVELALAAVSRGAQQMTAEYAEGLNEQFTHISGGHGLTAALLPSMFNALAQIPPDAGGLCSFSTLNTWKQDHVDDNTVQDLYAADVIFLGGMLAVLRGIRRLTAWAGGSITNQIMRVSNASTRTATLPTASDVLGGADMLARLPTMGCVLGSTWHYDVPVGAWAVLPRGGGIPL